MTDPVIEDVKTDAAKVESKVETAVVGTIKTHIAWVIGFGCFLLGALVGHLTR